MREPLLRVAGLSKSFPGLRALDDVSLEVHAGEVVAVVGHNGSGKSTLVKVLARVHQPDPGATIEVRDGTDQVLAEDAMRERIHFIHQDLGLVGMMSTVENLDLAKSNGRRGLATVRRSAEIRRARRLISRFGGRFDPTAPVAALSPAERTIVAIARATDGWTSNENVLVLDEPTTAFHGEEVDVLFAAVRRIAAAGAGVVFISHRLDEVLGLADRVVVMRDGRVLADQPAAELDHDQLVQLIAGGAVARLDRARAAEPTEPLLSVRGLVGANVRGLSFEVHAGEVVGISGILGSGREHVSGLLFGAHHREAGAVEVAGHEVTPDDPVAAIEAGMAYVPAERRVGGAVMEMSVRENLTLPLMRPLRRAFARLDRRAERRETERWMTAVDLKPRNPDQPLKLFSGGNQQKVVMAKWLRTRPQVLLLDEPTQGVDVGAQSAIHELVLAAARDGAAVLVCSSDAKELAALCDQVLVLDRGRVVTEIQRDDLSEARLVRDGLRVGGEPLAVHEGGSTAISASAAYAGQPGVGTLEPSLGREEVGDSAQLVAQPTLDAEVDQWQPRSVLARARRALLFRQMSAVYLFALMFVVFALWVPSTFLTSGTWRSLVSGQAISCLVALALVPTLAAGVFDLAVGSEVGLGAILVAWLLVDGHCSVAVAIGLTLLAGVAVGFVHWLLIVRGRIPSFIATLGMSSVLLAVIDWVSGSQQILDLPGGFQRIATGQFLGLQAPVYVMLAVALVLWYVLENTSLGRRIYATGANPAAARLAGVHTGLVVLIALVACGVVAGLAGLLETSQIATGDPTVGPGFLLPAIAAAFLGSTQFKNGRMNVWGTVVAAYVIATGVKGLQLAGLPVWIPDLFDGAVLIVAVGLAQTQAPSHRLARLVTLLLRRSSGPHPAVGVDNRA
jgi:ribose transport system ATP-binding protein